MSNSKHLDFKNICWVLSDFLESYKESEKMDITHTIKLDAANGFYDISVKINCDTEHNYKYVLPYPAKVVEVYDLLTSINDDIIYLLYSKHIFEFKRSII